MTDEKKDYNQEEQHFSQQNMNSRDWPISNINWSLTSELSVVYEPTFATIYQMRKKIIGNGS